MIALYAAVAMLVIGMVVFGVVRGSRRPRQAGPAPYGQQNMPQSFGGQPPYPQQGQYTNPEGQNPWHDAR